jgi:hypothetical protein
LRGLVRGLLEQEAIVVVGSQLLPELGLEGELVEDLVPVGPPLFHLVVVEHVLHVDQRQKLRKRKFAICYI